MKKIVLLLVFGVMGFGLFAQTPFDTVNVYDPQAFTEMTTIDPANFQFIGRKNSLNRRVHVDTMRNYMTPAVVHAWLGDPLDSVDVLSSYWRQFVTDSLGRVWYVDADGDAKMLKDTAMIGVSDGDKGDITVSASGLTWNIDAGVVGASELASTAVTPGSYTNTSLTVDADGRITAASSSTSDNGIFSAANEGATAAVEEFITGDTFYVNTNNKYGLFGTFPDYPGVIESGDGLAVKDDYVILLSDDFLELFSLNRIELESADSTYVQGANLLNLASNNKIIFSGDTLDASGVTTFLGFPGGVDTDNQTIDTFSRSGSTIYLSLEDDGEAAQQLNLSVFLQTLGTNRDTLSISGSGTQLRIPGPAFLRDSITGAALTIDLKTYNQAVVEIRMETCTSTTLTINNPWSATDIDNTYPTFEGETGVYSFHFLGISGTDNITWPADFLDMNGTALGTDALTTGTMYTCYRNPVSAKYYCK